MNLREDFSNMFEYDRWANTQWIQVTKDMGEESILMHNIEGQIVWLCRIEGTKFWKPTIEEFALHQERSTRNWKRFLMGADLQMLISYETSQGDHYDNTVAEIVRHVINHGTYHRGQLRGIAGERGIAFPETDYIAFMRKDAPARPGLLV